MSIPKPLPDCWWITPELNSIDELPELLALLDKRVEQGIRYVQFMQRKLDEPTFIQAYGKFYEYCQAKDVFVIIHGTSELAQKLEADGCCFYARDLEGCNSRPLPDKYWVGVYCWSVEELKKAKALKVDFASLSMIKPSASYPDRTPIGWDTFESAVKEVYPFPVYAVGGLNLSDKSEALKRGACGIMGIRYLYPDPWL